MRPGASAAAVQRGEAAPLIVAHRGAWGMAPQNSLEAVDDAVAMGCDAIEIDVRRTGDGRLVIVHDARVRLRPIGRLEHSQVQARMKVGQAPLLTDVLRAAAGRIIVDVELKEDGYVAEAMTAVTRHLEPEQYVLTSFRAEVLSQVKACAPGAQTGLLVAARRVHDLDRRVRAARVDFVAPHISLARTGGLTWAAKRGLPTWVWTVNDRRGLHDLTADPRVAAVITDRPERALAIRRLAPFPSR
ncbi:MAG: glycerophosphodiester phosphodiesterase [Solirubrobacteraceae bacterium]